MTKDTWAAVDKKVCKCCGKKYYITPRNEEKECCGECETIRRTIRSALAVCGYDSWQEFCNSVKGIKKSACISRRTSQKAQVNIQG